MVCTADDILGWRDFPKGLRVLLLDEDTNSVAEIKSKLENMDYIVSTFCNENEALAAISNKPKSFHVAIVEVNTGNRHGSYRFLETAIDIPIVMTSNIHCLSTMMKCIALGAAEFLQKPLSEDKLRNIWQHVVQKAFNAGGSAVSKSLKSVKETIVSRLHLQVETIKPENENQLETDVEAQAQAHKHDHEQSAASDGLPAPLTPQLKQGGRLLDEGYFQDNPNCGSMEKEYLDQEGESKSVEISCNNSVVKVNVEVDPSPGPGVAVIKEEDDSTEGSKTGSNVSSHLQDKDSVADSIVEARNPRKSSLLPTSCGIDNRKKMKVDWTPELHKRFVHAIEQLGVDQAIPSRILDLMKIEGLTRHNVASHLQKYRMHQRHIMPKEDNRRWHHPRYSVQREYGNKPIMAFPPYHPSHGFSTNQMYPVWGHPSSLPSSIQTWGHHGFPTWQPPEIWLQKMYTEMHANAWGCPLVPTPHGPCSTFPQNSWGSHSSNAIQDTGSLLRNSFELHPAEEVIDNVVKEAISKRWLPLPLGLKPPSIESVLSELHGQDSSNVPHTTANSC